MQARIWPDFTPPRHHFIKAVVRLQPLCDRHKATGENRQRHAPGLEGGGHFPQPFFHRQPVSQFIDCASIETFQQRKPGTVTFIKIELAAHRPGGDLGDLLANAGLSCELINDLTVNERGVHIKHRQPIGLAARCARLQRNVDTMFIRKVPQPCW